MSQRNGRQICELVFNKTQIDWKNWQSAGYTWAFSRSHGLLSLSCLVAHHTQFWVALFRYRNACKNELTNLKIVEMKKQLPKWRMKSYGIVLFRNLTSLSFSSVSRNMSTSPYSICMKRWIAPPKYFRQPQHQVQKCMFTGFRVTHHHRFPTKIAQPQITPGSPWNGTQIGLRRRLMSKVSSRCAKLSEAKVLLVSERLIFLLKLRGAVRKPVKNGQNMSGGRWCFVFFESVLFFKYIQICVHSDWRWVIMKTTINTTKLVYLKWSKMADLLRKW